MNLKYKKNVKNKKNKINCNKKKLLWEKKWQTSDVSEVGLLIEDDENGLCFCSVGVLRCSSIRFISIIGNTATPPTGLRPFGLWSKSSPVGETGLVTPDDVNAAEWRLLVAVGISSIEAAPAAGILLFLGERSNVDVS